MTALPLAVILVDDCAVKDDFRLSNMESGPMVGTAISLGIICRQEKSLQTIRQLTVRA